MMSESPPSEISDEKHDDSPSSLSEPQLLDNETASRVEKFLFGLSWSCY